MIRFLWPLFFWRCNMPVDSPHDWWWHRLHDPLTKEQKEMVDSTPAYGFQLFSGSADDIPQNGEKEETK